MKWSATFCKTGGGTHKVIYEEGLPNIQYMRKRANISPYMRRPLVMYDFATAPSEFPYI
jgi:hypothetical protein